jgi:formylglycine-generating enzyme required for sulfatase activity
MLGLLVALAGSRSTARVMADEPPASRTWVLLIGVADYTHARPLPETATDVERLRQTFLTIGGMTAESLVWMGDRHPAVERRPRRDTMERELSRVLERAAAEDTVLVYFSGHGFRGPANELYLAPPECDPADPARTGLAVSRIRRDLAASRARVKLLILDVCHAGTQSRETSGPVPATVLAAALKGDDRTVITLASSAEQQESLNWPGKGQSLFTYWLTMGLRGHADRDPHDGEIDFDELYRYTWRQVSRTAEFELGRPQTPVRDVRLSVDGIPRVLTLRPRPLDELLAEIAGLLGDALRQRRIPRVSVEEFVEVYAVESQNRDLARDLRQRLHNQLSEQSAGNFSLVDPGQALVRVVGSFQSDGAGCLHLQCRLQLTPPGQRWLTTVPAAVRDRFTLDEQQAGTDLGVLAGGLARHPKAPSREVATTGKNRGSSRSRPLRRNSLGMDLIWIPGGQFQMGSTANEPFRNPASERAVRVTLTRPFRLSRTEVTQRQWYELMRTRPWVEKEQGHVREGDDYPASCITWDEARQFCRTLGEREGRSYRLPSEAEWEFACRAGTSTLFSFGNDPRELDQHAWYGGLFSAVGSAVEEPWAHPVGLLRPNRFGLYDMHGNVGEWCEDVFQEQLPGGRDPLVTQPLNGRWERVTRGGGWFTPFEFCRSAFRFAFPPQERLTGVGFRVACEAFDE